MYPGNARKSNYACSYKLSVPFLLAERKVQMQWQVPIEIYNTEYQAQLFRGPCVIYTERRKCTAIVIGYRQRW